MTSDAKATVDRLLRQYPNAAEAAGKATENAFDLPPGSPGRAFWLMVLEEFAARGVSAIVKPNPTKEHLHRAHDGRAGLVDRYNHSR